MRSLFSVSSLLVSAFIWGVLVRALDSSLFNIHGSRSLKLPRYVHARDSNSSLEGNLTWPAFPFTITINQTGPSPEWLRLSYGGRSGTPEQTLILSSLIGNLSTTFSNSPTDILNGMSNIGSQSVHINFSLTPKLLTGKSFALAIQTLAALNQKWGAKEMVFEVGSGPQNTTTEGVFQVRLDQGLFTAGTGISSSLPFATRFESSSQMSSTMGTVPKPAATTVGHSSRFMPGRNSTVAAKSVPSGSVASLSGTQPSAGLGPTGNSSALRRTSARLNATTTPASSVMRSGGMVSSGTGMAVTHNSTRYLGRQSSQTGSNTAGSLRSSAISSGVSGRQGSFTMGQLSKGCTAGLCPMSVNSSQPLRAPLSTGVSIKSGASGIKPSVPMALLSTGCIAGLCPMSANSSRPLRAPLSTGVGIKSGASGIKPSVPMAPLSTGCTAGLCAKSTNSSQPLYGSLSTSANIKSGKKPSVTMAPIATGCTTGLCNPLNNSSLQLPGTVPGNSRISRDPSGPAQVINSLAIGSGSMTQTTSAALINSTIPNISRSISSSISLATSLSSSSIASTVTSSSASLVSSVSSSHVSTSISSTISTATSTSSTMTSLPSSNVGQTSISKTNAVPTSTPPASRTTIGFTTATILTTSESSAGASTAGFTTIYSTPAAVDGDGGGHHHKPFPIIIPIVVPVEVPIVIPVPIVEPIIGDFDPGSPENPDSDDTDRERKSQSLDNQSKTKASASLTRTNTQASSTIFSRSSSASRTLSMNATITSFGPTGTGCFSFNFNDGPWDLNNSSDIDPDTGDGEDDSSVLTDDQLDVDPNEYADDVPQRLKRAQISREHSGKSLAGRMYLGVKGKPLQKRMKPNAEKATTLGTCVVAAFTRKPQYPVAKEVTLQEIARAKSPDPKVEAYFATASIDRPARQPHSMDAFFSTASYWVVPLSNPPDSCALPSWDQMNTEDVQNENPPWVIGGSDNVKTGTQVVNMDHVYETHYLMEFFADKQEDGTLTCSQIQTVLNKIDTSPEAASTNPRAFIAGTRINTLFSMLPRYANPEFVGMAQRLNYLKMQVVQEKWEAPQLQFKGVDTATGDPIEGPSSDSRNDIINYGRLAVLFSLLNDEGIRTLLERTNARIYKAFQSIDQLHQDNNCAKLEENFWADAYKDYMTKRWTTLNDHLESRLTHAVAAIRLAGIPDDPDYLDRMLAKYPIAAIKHPIPTDWDYGLPAVNILKRDVNTLDPAACAKITAVSAINATALTSMPRGTGQVAINSLGTGAASIVTPLSVTPIPTTPSTTTPPTTSSTSTSATPTGTAANGDPCGPTVQEPGYPNTCNATVPLVTTVSQYGSYCNPSGDQGSIVEAFCSTPEKTMCQNIQKAGFPTGAWVWQDEGNGCAVGVWLPNPDGSALIPSADRCENMILEPMLDNCYKLTAPNVFSSVNLASLPSFSDPSQTGSQVNAGYPSYIVAPKSPPGLTGTWAGYTAATVGEPSGALNPKDQDQNVEPENGPAVNSGSSQDSTNPALADGRNVDAGSSSGGSGINF